MDIPDPFLGTSQEFSKVGDAIKHLTFFMCKKCAFLVLCNPFEGKIELIKLCNMTIIWGCLWQRSFCDETNFNCIRNNYSLHLVNEQQFSCAVVLFVCDDSFFCLCRP